MSGAIISFFQQFNIPSELIVFFISMLPILELRAGIIAAAFLNIPILRAIIVCFLGNILPIPFILLFIKKIFALMRTHKIFPKLVDRLEKLGSKKSESIKKKQTLGLLLFVAIPLPGTGAWTGALAASLMDLPVLKSFLTIVMGVLGAETIMLTLTYLLPDIFGKLFGFTFR